MCFVQYGNISIRGSPHSTTPHVGAVRSGVRWGSGGEGGAEDIGKGAHTNTRQTSTYYTKT